MNQISPLAYVHPEAKLGDNNIIGPFCFIDKNTVIGDNNNLQNSVTVHTGARIGNGNEFFPGASISTKPQDLKFAGEETTCIVGDNNSIRENVTISEVRLRKALQRWEATTFLWSVCMWHTTVCWAADASSATLRSLQEKCSSMTTPSSAAPCCAISSAISEAT